MNKEFELVIDNRGRLQINNARICFRNFSGEETMYNRAGNRNFSVIIPDEEATKILEENGWNVKVKPPIDLDESPFMTLPVKIKFNAMGPKVYLLTGRKRLELTEETVDMLDSIDISNVDLDIRPYDWEYNNKTGRAAYLDSICITQNTNRFEERFEEMDEEEL